VDAPAQSLGAKCTSFRWHISDLFTPTGAIHEEEPSRYREPRAKIQATQVKACLPSRKAEGVVAPPLDIDHGHFCNTDALDPVSGDHDTGADIPLNY
jgi:hypothetical protein